RRAAGHSRGRRTPTPGLTGLSGACAGPAACQRRLRLRRRRVDPGPGRGALPAISGPDPEQAHDSVAPGPGLPGGDPGGDPGDRPRPTRNSCHAGAV
ncbi:uncharacterized protein METZ01_LOCUS371822, partial [marine metagenome]